MESLKQKNAGSSGNSYFNPRVAKGLYRPDIDGLRGLAVLVVIFFHYGVPGFTGGFVGVDVFLVISGYLITQILISGLEGPFFSLRVFYERRVRRILPALLTVISAVMLWSLISQSPFSARDTAQSVFASTLFLSNILYISESANYFGIDSELKPLLHTWSLSLEWQYYMVFPVLLLFTLRLNQKVLLPALICFLVISSALAFKIDDTNQTTAYYSLHYRAWEFIAGSIVALIKPYIDITHISTWLKGGLCNLGLALIFWSVWQYTEATPFPGWHATIPVLGAFLLLSFADRKKGAAWLLTTSAFVSIGRISYSLYLWHFPVLVMFRHHFAEPLSSLGLGSAILLTFVLSVFTWYFIEVPARNSKRFPTTFLVVTCIILGSLLLGLGFLGHKSIGFQQFKMANIKEERRWIVVDHFTELMEKEELSSRLLTNLAPIPANDTLIVIGDSIAGDLILALRSNNEMINTFNIERISLHAECLQHLAKFDSGHLSEVSLGHCGSYDYDQIYEQILAADQVILAFALDVNSAPSAISLAKTLKTKSNKIYLMDAPRFHHLADISYQFAKSDEDLALLSKYMFKKLSDKYLSTRDYIRKSLAQPLEPSFIYIDRFELYCSEIDYQCSLYSDKRSPLIHDQHHLSTAGIQDLGNWIVRYFQIKN